MPEHFDLRRKFRREISGRRAAWRHQRYFHIWEQRTCTSVIWRLRNANANIVSVALTFFTRNQNAALFCVWNASESLLFDKSHPNIQHRKLFDEHNSCLVFPLSVDELIFHNRLRFDTIDCGSQKHTLNSVSQYSPLAILNKYKYTRFFVFWKSYWSTGFRTVLNSMRDA